MWGVCWCVCVCGVCVVGVGVRVCDMCVSFVYMCGVRCVCVISGIRQLAEFLVN